jgi:hypothetical protein
VTEVIKGHRNSGAPVEGTSANELQVALRYFGYDLVLVTDFGGNPLPPTFAAWERAQIDMDSAFIIEVTGHWTAYRGGWFCDSLTGGVPVKAKLAAGRRKRVRRVYGVYKGVVTPH